MGAISQNSKKEITIYNFKNIKMIALLVLNYLTRVQSEYYFSSDANVSFNVIEKNGKIVLKRLVGIRSK